MHTALSLTLYGTEVLKKATEELPELMTGGGFHFMCFFICMGSSLDLYVFSQIHTGFSLNFKKGI